MSSAGANARDIPAGGQALQTSITGTTKTLSIMPTFTCPAECRDCGTLSGPKDRTRLDIDTILAAIGEARDLGFVNVVFTGGEATLRWKDLLEAIAFADSLGFPTRVVTNAYWAVSSAQAERRVDQLRDHGLREINFSTGDEHVRFIPLERVVTATRASLARELAVHIMVELRAERAVTREVLLELLKKAGLTSGELDKISILESPWMPLDPRQNERYPAEVATDRKTLPLRPGCDSVLKTYTLQADGSIGACCGLGMRVMPELLVGETKGEGFLARAIEEAESDFLKLWNHIAGPEKILAWAQGKNPAIEWEGMYAHHCQACRRIYSDPLVADIITEHYEEVISEVIQSAWLDERYVPSRLAKN